MQKTICGLAAIPFILFSAASVAATASAPNTFVVATPAKAAEVNANFQALVDAINANKVPAGTVIAYAGPTCPAGTLLADGIGNNVNTFNLPDYRGRFLRGMDGTAGNDPDSATRTAMATGGSETRPKNVYVNYCIYQ